MISIKKFRQSDIDKEYLSWLNNKKLMKFSRHSKEIFDKTKAINFYQEMKRQNNFFFVILLKKQSEKKIGTLIGYTTKKNKSCNLGILVGRQGKGYGKKAYKIAIDYIFKYGYKSIIGGSLATNLAMIKIFKNSGMKFLKNKNIFYKNYKKKRKVVYYIINKD